MTKIAIASCCKIQFVPDQPGWKEIEDTSPDLLLLLGDNVYMQNRKWDHAYMEDRYKEQLMEPHFKSLLKKVPYLATWDDHDFGPNDTNGAEVDDKLRQKSRRLFRKYMRDPRLRSRVVPPPNTMGIHYSMEIDDIKIIMLDVRYYRTRKSRSNATMLGEEQEEWLWHELEHDRRYTIVAGGSAIGRFRNGESGYEGSWSGYPRFLKEFRRRVKRSHRVLVLGGDIHRNKFKSHGNFFEVVSSGIGRPEKRGNRRRQPMHNYGILEFSRSRVDISLKSKTRRDVFKKINSQQWQVA